MHLNLWLSLLLVTLSLLPRAASAQLLSPGDLSRVHAKLEGDEHCMECHSSGKRVDAQLCNHCHKDIARELASGSGLHGKQYKTQPCGECHIEHRGTAHDLVRWPGGDRARFEHKLTGYVLAGKHAEVSCNKCHTSKNERGAPTFMGLSTNCSSCHKDPHDNRFGSTCQKCHNEKSWKATDLSGFNHALTRFPLRGKHDALQCRECHGAPPDVKYRPLAFESCTSCHKDPHQGHFSNVCTSCHTEDSWKNVHMQRDSHPGLSLSGGHAKLQCAGCHDRGNDKPPSKGKACVSCHAPIHEAPFGSDCARCHKRIEWLGVSDALALEAHAQTVFPLRGAHHEVNCDKCHLPKIPLDKRYRKLTFAHCRDCHADAHASEFAARDGGECAACHDEHAFAPSSFGTDAHSSTAFPLLGRHQAVACVACHRATTERARTERATKPALLALPALNASSRVNWHITEQRCADCHDNPHGDQFAREMAAGGCAHCHNPTAWNVPSVDHSIWPLTGSHAGAQCAACHDLAGSAGKTNYRGVPRTCEGCHDDPHAGQFRLHEPARACSECHDTRSFKIAQFDHQKLTAYPLEGLHQKVACDGCHRAEQLRNGTQAVRYRLTYCACADCYKNPHAEEKRP